MKLIKRIFLLGFKIFIKIFVVYDVIFHTRIQQKSFYWYLKKKGIKINGEPCFISTDVFFDINNYGEINIGKGVVISLNVIILIHDYSISKAMVANDETLKEGCVIVKSVSIGKNVFIGAGSIILPGTKIGDNVIVGAGTVVRGNISNNVVITGNPCKVVRTIEEHLKVQCKYNSKNFHKG